MIRLNLIRSQSCSYRRNGPRPITGIVIGSRLGSLDSTRSFRVDSSPPSLSKAEALALTRELLLLMLSGQRQSEAVLTYLAAAELTEPDVWLRDDIRISWLCVLHCAELLNSLVTIESAARTGKRRGELLWEYAFTQYLGRHPSKLIPEFLARAARHAAMESSPKKSVQSVTDPRKRRAA